MGQTVVESISIAADAAAVYALVSDVASMGQWSPEAAGAAGAGARLAVGDRFVGVNRRGPVRWLTVCTVTVADPPRAFAFLVDLGPIPLSRWRYDIGETGDGVVLTETWEDRRSGISGPPTKLLGQFLIPGSRPAHNRRSMRTTLARMRSELEGGPANAGT